MKKYRPVTSGTRFKKGPDFKEISRKKPEKSLLRPLKRRGGRCNLGRVTSGSRGGGAKRAYRVIDFKRDKTGVPARVAAVEYDPNRSARIALLHYFDGEKRYIIAPLEVKVGDVLQSGPGSPVRAGNNLPLREIPLGRELHNIELMRGRGGQLVRSAGAAAQLLAKEGEYAHVKLPSGELRMIHLDCRATIGQVGNVDHRGVSLGKAGASRWRGRRPHTRGVAKNPVDHPMGGGEGKSSGGRHPCTPTGVPTKGYRTRKKKFSDRYVIKRRK